MTKKVSQQREVHFWAEKVEEPPCGTNEDYFQWSDDPADVTCERCREAIARDDPEHGGLDLPGSDQPLGPP